MLTCAPTRMTCAGVGVRNKKTIAPAIGPTPAIVVDAAAAVGRHQRTDNRNRDRSTIKKKKTLAMSVILSSFVSVSCL